MARCNEKPVLKSDINNNNLTISSEKNIQITKRKQTLDQQAETLPTKLPKLPTNNTEDTIDAGLKQSVFSFIQNDQILHMNVLNYVPLDFKTFSEQLVNGSPVLTKIEDKTLMKILDEYGVTFTLKSFNSRRRRSGRKKIWQKRRK